MKAMIFAAGLGTRLRPLTDSIPKALVPVGDKPMLQHVLEHMRLAGIREVVVNVHHFPDMIRQFLAANGNFGLEISVSDERDCLLDTGGGLVRAIPLLDDREPVLLHNADILTDLPLPEMIEFHENHMPDATLLAWDRESSRRLLFDSGGAMKGWCNMATGEIRPSSLDSQGLSPLAFGGIHVVSPSLFPSLEEYARRKGPVFSITPFYVEACQTRDIRAFTPNEPFDWFDIGRPESLRKASQFISERYGK